jgi:transcription elongation factor Elf1
MVEKTVQITVKLTPEQAYALAQFCKRASVSDFQQKAVDGVEAYNMWDSINEVREALQEVGHAPR